MPELSLSGEELEEGELSDAVGSEEVEEAVVSDMTEDSEMVVELELANEEEVIESADVDTNSVFDHKHQSHHAGPTGDDKGDHFVAAFNVAHGCTELAAVRGRGW